MGEGKIVWREVHVELGRETNGSTPAVKVTHGGRAMYSYTAGVIDKEDHFRPYLHLSDVYISEFIQLFQRAASWVQQNSVRAKKRDGLSAPMSEVAKSRG